MLSLIRLVLLGLIAAVMAVAEKATAMAQTSIAVTADFTFRFYEWDDGCSHGAYVTTTYPFNNESAYRGFYDTCTSMDGPLFRGLEVSAIDWTRYELVTYSDVSCQREPLSSYTVIGTTCLNGFGDAQAAFNIKTKNWGNDESRALAVDGVDGTAAVPGRARNGTVSRIDHGLM